MASSLEPHPSKAVLFAFAEGLGSDLDLQALENHVAECDTCAAMLTELDVRGGLVEDLRSAFVRGEASTDQGGETVPGRDDSRAVAAVQAFLQSPGRPGSLGRLGHYEILEIAGRGTFGTVFQAFDDLLERVVALKVLTPDLATTAEARQRFLREARAAAAIRHENVVQIHSVHEEPLPYLVMEFIPGMTVQQRLDKSGPFCAAEVVRMGRQMAAGLAAAHARGLIHRDIKPGNILLDPGEEERVKITDFGLARPVNDTSASQSGMIAGTPLYMSPEQINGQELDPRSDLFSLGTVLYAMLCGRSPFRGTNTLAVIKSVSEDLPRPIDEIVPDVPPELSAIVCRLHAKLPEDRFQSAREVAEALALCGTRAPRFPSETSHADRRDTSGTVRISSGPPDTIGLERRRKTDLPTEIWPQPPRLAKWKSILSWGVLTAAVLIAVVIIRTNKSEFVIETESSEIAATLTESGGIMVEDRQTGQVLHLVRGPNRLPNGDYDLTIKMPEGLEFAVPQVQLRRFGSAVATIRARKKSTELAGVPIAPGGNTALRFYQGQSAVEIPTLRRDDTGPLTIEMRLKLLPQSAAESRLGVIFSLEGRAAYQFQPQVDKDLSGTELSTGEDVSLVTNFGPDGWHHVACVLNETEHRIYIDGHLAAQMPRIPRDQVGPLNAENSSLTMLGSQMFDGDRLYHGLEGEIDEVRVSKTARYDKDFVPAERFEADRDTLALYHCDEGQNDILHDFSGNSHHGKLVGVSWVPYDGSPSITPTTNPPVIDPNRELAEYLLAHNGSFDCTVNSTGVSIRDIFSVNQVPTQSFTVRSVSLRPATDPDVRRVVELAEGRIPIHNIYISGGDGKSFVTGAMLKELTRLRGLDIVGIDNFTDVTADDVETLSELPNLYLLNLANLKFGDEVLKRIHKFPKVSNLLLNHCDVSDDGLLPLRMSRVSRLFVNSPLLTDRACEVLAQVPLLHDLSLEGSQHFTGAELAKLQLREIHRLQFAFTALRDDSLTCLSGFPKLEALVLNDNLISDQGLTRLVGLPLKSLELHEPRVTREALRKLHVALPKCQIQSNFATLDQAHSDDSRRLAEWIISQGGGFVSLPEGFSNLTAEIRKPADIPSVPFVIYQVSLYGATSAHITQLIELAANKVPVEEVYIAAPSEKEQLPGGTLQQLTQMQSLVGIAVSNVNVTRADVTALAALPKFKNLGIADVDLPADALADLPACKRLRILILNNCQVTDEQLRSLTQIPSIENLYLNSAKLTDGIWETLAHLPKLNRLDLISCDRLKGEGLALIGDRSWDSINFRLTGVRDEALQYFTGFKSIRSLSLWHNGITDAGLKYVGGIPSLQRLELDEAKVGNAGMEELVSLSMLQSLFLTGTNVTDAGLEPISRLANLEELGLSELAITDVGVSHVVRMKRLVKLSLEGTQVTAAGVQQLRTALPRCEIIWTAK